MLLELETKQVRLVDEESEDEPEATEEENKVKEELSSRLKTLDIDKTTKN